MLPSLAGSLPLGNTRDNFSFTPFGQQMRVVIRTVCSTVVGGFVRHHVDLVVVVPVDLEILYSCSLKSLWMLRLMREQEPKEGIWAKGCCEYLRHDRYIGLGSRPNRHFECGVRFKLDNRRSEEHTIAVSAKESLNFMPH
jgi:hypothetical protein